MEKALKILKELLVDVKKDIEAEGIDGFGYIETQLEKSIVELEYAMKPKTCDGCKYLDGVICKHDRGLYCVRQFEADYFEKDTK